MNKRARTVYKECIAHHYWRHMDDPKSFFKFMVGDFKNGMTIPKKFVANIKVKISEQVTLKVPDGKTYTVEVAEEQQNGLVFRSGWAEFASAYKLELGDLVVFTTSGNSHFTVQIFDRSGCKKELSCIMLDSIPCVQERKGSHGKQMQSPTGKRLSVGSPSGSRKTSKMNPIDSPSQKKRHVSPTKRHEVAKPPNMLPRHTSLTDEQSKVEEKAGAVQSETPKMNPTDSPSQKKTEHVPSSEGIYQEPINSGASQKLIKSCIGLPTGCSMTKEQEAKVISLEQKIQPKIPFYITAMYKESLASGILSISKRYVMEHLTDENGPILIYQLDGSKVWTINLYIATDGEYAVSTGWLEFIRDNKLGEGDICIFQPARSKNDRAKLIFRTLEENRCLQPPGLLSPTKRHGVAKPAYVLSPRSSLTDEQRSIVEEKVRAMQSEIPVYVTVMTKCNVNSSMGILGISKPYAREYLPGDGGGEKQLSMRMRLRHKDDAWEPEFQIKRGRQQILGKGWKNFVIDNKLKRDDICLFNLVKNTKMLTMDVHFIRKKSV